MWLRVPSEPAAFAVKESWVLPSPQSTSTVHGLPLGSANEPRSMAWEAPSVADWLAPAVTLGCVAEVVA